MPNNNKQIAESLGKTITIVKEHPTVSRIGGTTVVGGVIGSIIPGVGTAIGASVGAIIGGVCGIIKECKKQ